MYALINKRGYVTGIYESSTDGSVELPSGADLESGFRYRYQDNAWSDAFSGVADADIMAAYFPIQQGWDLEDNKAAKMVPIKFAAAAQIEATNWKVERAIEVDAATGSSTLAAVYAERAAIRTASNTKEAALEALTTWEAVQAFDPADF
jgi:hypothetical protein